MTWYRHHFFIKPQYSTQFRKSFLCLEVNRAVHTLRSCSLFQIGCRNPGSFSFLWIEKSILFSVKDICYSFPKKLNLFLFRSLEFFSCRTNTRQFQLANFAFKKCHSIYVFLIDLVTVFDAILTSGKMCEKLQCLYENLMSYNFHKTAVLKKISIVN